MERASEPAGSGAGTRAGYVALVGLPNVGKSTLLNAFTGERLSIVTPRAQTTRERVSGIYVADDVQIIFVDTPGLLEPRYLLHQSMLQAARTAVRECDEVLLLLDATRPGETPRGDALSLLEGRGHALFVAVNKIDAAEAEDVTRLQDWSRRTLGLDAWRISALRGDGVAPLRDALGAGLPPSPFLYPADELAVQPVRFFVAELIRETVFEAYEQEIPYSVAVTIDEYREAADPVYIRATLIVERDSQKGILIGRGGAAIKSLGQSARRKVEAFLGSRVYLDLWVKVQPGWRKKSGLLKELGYEPPSNS